MHNKPFIAAIAMKIASCGLLCAVAILAFAVHLPHL